MFKFLFFILAFHVIAFSQNIVLNPTGFKGDHFVIYNKCKTPVLFCESTQQIYTFCGANKNCQGLYVNPGDTFLLNYEDKAQLKTIISDITFQGYITTVFSHTFQPVQNCIPPQALQVIIPLTAVPGSSFQINAENPNYDPTENPAFPFIPVSIYVYVGGQQPISTTALSNFTNCPIADTSAVDVSVKEIFKEVLFTIYPNPASESITISSNSVLNNFVLLVFDCYGNEVLKTDFLNRPIPLSNIANGMYYACLYINGRIAKAEKFVIAR